MNRVTDPVIKAIETEYRGIRFRSRIEARWAVFFDQVKTSWQYEPEGFHLPAGTYGDKADDDQWPGREIELTHDARYLPDFLLTDLDSWFEVKGVSPDDAYWNLLAAFEIATDKRVLIAIGDIPIVVDDDYCGQHEVIHTIGDIQYEFCRCPMCDRLGCEFNGRGDRVCRHDLNDKGYNVTDDIVAAYRVARSYRFWDPRHG